MLVYGWVKTEYEASAAIIEEAMRSQLAGKGDRY